MAQTVSKNAKMWTFPTGVTFTQVDTIVERDALTPSTGDHCYVTDTGLMYDYNGASWDTTDQHCTIDFTHTESADEFESTDSCSNGFAEAILGRKESTISANRNLKDTSGSVIQGDTIDFTYNSVNPNITNFSGEFSIDEFDVTTQKTASGFKEFATDLKRGTFTVSVSQQDTDTDFRAGAAKATYLLTFKTGYTIGGEALVKDRNVVVSRPGATKVDYSFTNTGTFTFTGLTPDIGTVKQWFIKTADKKTYYGDSGYVQAWGFDADVLGDVIKTTETWRLNGADTETQG